MKPNARTGARVARRWGILAAAGLAITSVAAVGMAEPPASGAATAEEAIDFSALAGLAGRSGGGNGGSKDALPKWEDVSDGYEKIISTADGDSLYNIYINRETGDMLAELPRGFERQRHFFALTVSGGVIFAGLQGRDIYTYWKQYGKDRLALVQPQIEVRSTGDQESKDSIKNIFTDRVLLDVPIVAKGPSGQPVIDLDDLLVGQAAEFFGGQARGLNKRLKEVAKAKAFPENIEVAYTVPDSTGLKKTFHYSISKIQGTPGYQPREADTRVGYFTTSYRDLGQVRRDEVATRYINRWNIQKADNNLRLSPPKEPIVYYVEHTVPIRYRRWVKEGIEYWNKAYRNVGIDGAIEVRYQDKASGAHMDKDPEDVRYNFIRWLNNDISTAIGPSRVDPMTGEILDADVVLTDGWLRVFTYRWEDLLGDMAIEGFGPEALSWLAENPQWDPRVRLAAPSERERLIREAKTRGIARYGGHPAAAVDPTLIGDDEFDGLIGRGSQIMGVCNASQAKAFNMAMAMMHFDSIGALSQLQMAEAEGDELDLDDIPPAILELMLEELKKNPEYIEFVPEKYRAKLKALLAGETAETEEPADEDERADWQGPSKMATKPSKPSKWGDTPTIDGIPESFVGPMLAELVAHEVGHTLGLRHNFKGSSAYTLAEINSEEFKGKKPWSTTVMDYNGINIYTPTENADAGSTQGDYSVIDIGPYDMWAIEFGYGFGDRDEVLSRVSDPELQYGTDEDTFGPDPLARRYDLSANPLDWARASMAMVREKRDRLVDEFVEDGESWARARQGYQITLGTHVSAVSAMANWVGGAHVYRDKKGDPGNRAPLDVVEADTQREALDFVITNTFYDDAFGLTPNLLKYMTVDKWSDGIGGLNSYFADPTFDVHDRVLGIQSSAMTMLLNPTTLRRVYDNEYAIPDGEDALTLPEMLRTITSAAWEEIEKTPSKRFTAREPMISSLRRNLQREHVERLIDLALPGTSTSASDKPIATLATMHLREIHGKTRSLLNGVDGRIDDYSRAHLEEVALRIEKALDAQYIYNADEIGGGGGSFNVLFGADAREELERLGLSEAEIRQILLDRDR